MDFCWKGYSRGVACESQDVGGVGRGRGISKNPKIGANCSLWRVMPLALEKGVLFNSALPRFSVNHVEIPGGGDARYPRRQR